MYKEEVSRAQPIALTAFLWWCAAGIITRAGLKSRTPVESRALLWLAFAASCLADSRHAAVPRHADPAAVVEVAQELADETPYVIAQQALQIQVHIIHCDRRVPAPLCRWFLTQQMA